MKFKGHESFYIRRGWLYKGLKNIQENPGVFLAKNAMEHLGLGSNMVKSLRYWLQATGLTAERSEGGRRLQRATQLGQLIWEHDPYMEELGTLWLLHAQLAQSSELATAWYMFFHVFGMQEFQKEDFVRFLQQHTDAAASSLASDFDCLMSTYIPRSLLKGKADPESNTECPLGELGLIAVVDSRKKLYRRKGTSSRDVPGLIFLAVLRQIWPGRQEIRLQEIMSGTEALPGPAQIFQLDIVGVMQVLYRLERWDRLKVIRTAGLDVVRLATNEDMAGCVEEYYQGLAGE